MSLSKKRKRVFIYTVVIFISLISIQTLYLFIKMRSYMQSEHNNTEKELFYSAHLVHHLTDFAYDTILNVHDIRELLAKIISNPLDNSFRLKLYEKLLPDYINLTKHGIVQLQFHTKDSHSILRFFHPMAYGDDLNGARDSVVYVNSTQQVVDGYEIGKFIDGWRYIYPMYDNNGSHIGSVGITLSTLSLKKLLEKRGAFSVDFIISKDEAKQKLLNSQYKNYSTFRFNSNFLEYKDLVEYDKKKHNKELKERVFSKIFDSDTLSQMAKKESFTILTFDSFTPIVIYFIPLKNAIKSKSVGYVIVTQKNEHIYYMIKYYYVMVVVILIFSILFGLLIDRQLKLKESKKRLFGLYKTILDFTDNMIIVYNNGKIESTNRAFKEFVGKKDKYEKVDFCSLMDTTLDSNLPCSIDELINRLESDGNIILYMKNKNGYTQEFEVIKHIIDQKSRRYIIEFKNISDIFEEKNRLEKEVFEDYLTKLLNRKAFDGALLKAIQSVKQDKRSVSIIMIDIDNFKQINDKYGHEVGDRALEVLANILRSSLKEHIFRWGGEEFMVLVEADIDSAYKIAESLREKIQKATLEDDTIPAFTCSFGVVQIDENSSILDILSRVDKALYRAKEAGRNRVVIG